MPFVLNDGSNVRRVRRLALCLGSWESDQRILRSADGSFGNARTAAGAFRAHIPAIRARRW
jgi:hypothetical protein